jgi:PIN domain nuclease of toxin-antitoxin system
MKLLLDTHVLLWAVLEPHKLNRGLREALENPETQLLISAASAWEIATKWRLGKLPGASEVVDNFQRAIDGLGALECPILSGESLLAGRWTVPHRDPFDRILAAQALLRDLTLATTDVAFHQFEGLRLFGG